MCGHLFTITLLLVKVKKDWCAVVVFELAKFTHMKWHSFVQFKQNFFYIFALRCVALCFIFSFQRLLFVVLVVVNNVSLC